MNKTLVLTVAAIGTVVTASSFMAVSPWERDPAVINQGSACANPFSDWNKEVDGVCMYLQVDGTWSETYDPQPIQAGDTFEDLVNNPPLDPGLTVGGGGGGGSGGSYGD